MAKVECPTCGNDVSLTKGGIFYRHGTDGVSCPTSGEPAPGNERLPPAAPPLPGVDAYAEALADTAPSPFSQPAQPPSRSTRQRKQVRPMTALGERVAAELRQMFYHYQNRKTDDNRSAQTTLGPSEIGTPCDRRLALSLMRFPPVNPGGDGWASFVGTCVHEGVAKMLQWADGSTGRYAVELPLQFPSVHVPRGTGDKLDRVLCLFADHKMMGGWSLDKLKTEGPSRTYEVQVQVYAYGARARGEVVNSVAIIGWPRDKSVLDDLYVWTDDYRPDVAREALARVDRIAESVAQLGTADHFPVADDCKFCPFHLPGAKPLREGGQGCNGRQ